MQEARYVVGDRRLFQRFRRCSAENVYRKDFGQFLETALAERDQRYRKFGGSPYMGEPNVKESAGGLRDLHTAMWLASTKFGARTLRELLEKGLITERERGTADGALTFLWRVRNELHFLSGHKNDVLSRDVQPQIAKNFGYESDERVARRREVHARLLPSRPRHPPRVEPPDRALPGDAVAPGHGAAPAPPGGAGRRPLRAWTSASTSSTRTGATSAPSPRGS